VRREPVIRGARPGIVLLAVLAAAAFAGAQAPAAAAATTWLCKPGSEPDPCYGSLRTTIAAPDGSSSVEDVAIPKRRKIDCFYVYPTVSEDEGTNADLSIDPEQIAIARFQASRFSQRCRVFAPMYRQLTLTGISNADVPRSALDLAYSDVRAAWLEYWRTYNKGRGVVLIGHSQGTGMLTYLMREMIDPYKGARRRLVSAMLLGGNVVVQQGASRGGSFNRIPACRKPKKTGCVIAYSIFDEPPPADARFGRVGGTFADVFGLAGRTDLEVLCTNPAALRGGGPAELTTLMPTDPFPGIIGIGVAATFNGSLPTASTPWIQPAGRYAGECVNSDGASVLRISPIGSAENLNELPDKSWGIHLGDVNIPLGDLVDLAGVQAKSWLQAKARRKAKR
jgi:hypothetical protein